MLGKYKAAFIIPVSSRKILEETGWEFDTEKRLPDEVLDFLTVALNMKFSEKSSGMSIYVGENMKATVFYDDHGKIEHVYFQIFQKNEGVLSSAYQASPLTMCSELFIPSERNDSTNLSR